MDSDTTYTPREAFENIFRDEGIQYPIENEMKLIELSRKGVSKGAVSRVAKYGGLSLKEMAVMLPVSERTLHRYDEREKLSGDISERVLFLARILVKGTEVFGSEENMRAWIRTPIYALGNQSPLSIMDTLSGMHMVLDTLGRIEHGVYS